MEYRIQSFRRQVQNKCACCGILNVFILLFNVIECNNFHYNFNFNMRWFSFCSVVYYLCISIMLHRILLSIVWRISVCWWTRIECITWWWWWLWKRCWLSTNCITTNRCTWHRWTRWWTCWLLCENFSNLPAIDISYLFGSHTR